MDDQLVNSQEALLLAWIVLVEAASRNACGSGKLAHRYRWVTVLCDQLQHCAVNPSPLMTRHLGRIHPGPRFELPEKRVG